MQPNWPHIAYTAVSVLLVGISMGLYFAKRISANTAVQAMIAAAFWPLTLPTAIVMAVTYALAKRKNTR